jgi:hypothetical protein
MAARRSAYPRAPRITFEDFKEASAWGIKHGDENCLPYQIWRVLQIGNIYAVAVYSRNTGYFSHYAG